MLSNIQNEQVRLALSVLINVQKGKTTCDSQTANIILNYISEQEDKLHRRNLLIRQKDKRIKELEDMVSKGVWNKSFEKLQDPSSPYGDDKGDR